MKDADYIDDMALLVNTPSQTEFLQYRLDQATGYIGLRMNANKKEFMSFKQGATSNQSGKSLKLVDKFTLLGSNIASTEGYVNIRLVKA